VSLTAKRETPYLKKVIILFILGKFPQALAEYEEAIRRDPSVAKYHSNLGTAYIKLVEFPRARDCFDKALEKDPKFVKAYAKKGDCHYMMKEFHKALESYEAGLKIDS
jgi:stress-induced-phosphoprotein 1